MREMGVVLWSTAPGIAVLVPLLGQLSFGAEGRLQKPVVGKKCRHGDSRRSRFFFFATHVPARKTRETKKKTSLILIYNTNVIWIAGEQFHSRFFLCVCSAVVMCLLCGAGDVCVVLVLCVLCILCCVFVLLVHRGFVCSVCSCVRV